MTTTIISNTPPFGLVTNEMVANLFLVDSALSRLQAAISNAASNYPGTAGTEYEGNGSLFGVVASETPGAKGADYAYAVNVIAGAWATFWAAALPAIQAIDNGATQP